MQALDAHAAAYGEQPERRHAYLTQIVQERTLKALEAELQSPHEKPAKTKPAPEA